MVGPKLKSRCTFVKRRYRGSERKSKEKIEEDLVVMFLEGKECHGFPVAIRS